MIAPEGESPQEKWGKVCLVLDSFCWLFSLLRKGLRGRSSWHVLFVPFLNGKAQGIGKGKTLLPLRGRRGR